MGTDKQTNGRTNRGTNKRTNIYSIFRDKLSLPEGSLDRTTIETSLTKTESSYATSIILEAALQAGLQRESSLLPGVL
jgi:hypothetical protein